MINVLQAMILTDKEMPLTPTYHVFALYQPFQDTVHYPASALRPSYHLITMVCPRWTFRREEAMTGGFI
jgi:alpha-L-arabinofuranosidase